jgi:hypothetical protein
MIGSDELLGARALADERKRLQAEKAAIRAEEQRTAAAPSDGPG